MRGLTSILTVPPSLPFPSPFSLLLFLSCSFEAKGKEEEEEEENEESRWGNVRGEIAGGDDEAVVV